MPRAFFVAISRILHQVITRFRCKRLRSLETRLNNLQLRENHSKKTKNKKKKKNWQANKWFLHVSHVFSATVGSRSGSKGASLPVSASAGLLDWAVSVGSEPSSSGLASSSDICRPRVKESEKGAHEHEKQQSYLFYDVTWMNNKVD